MTTTRRPRADAVRNAERIVRAGRAAFHELGADTPLEEVARQAGVGVATLYRHFSGKEQLLRAIVLQQFTEEVEPAIAQALADPDGWHGVVTLLEAAIGMAAREHTTFIAAKDTALLPELAGRYFGPLQTLVRRAQDAGQMRADLEPDDLPRLLTMLVATLRVAQNPELGWRRYLALLLDALRPAAATPLPPAGPRRTRADGCD
jgi:AcrR family transcriptional regulator